MNKGKDQNCMVVTKWPDGIKDKERCIVLKLSLTVCMLEISENETHFR